MSSPYREPAEPVEVTLNARDIAVIYAAISISLNNTQWISGPFVAKDFEIVMSIVDGMMKKIKVVVHETQ